MPVRRLALALFLITAGPAAAQSIFTAAQPPPPEHAQMIAEMGGLAVGPAVDYVARVGEDVAKGAGKSGQCAFHLVNSEIVNAFTAPPGCHVYVTRGLLGMVNSEEEVAGVLGHEIGHVVANHAGRRQSRSQMAGIGAAVLGAVTKSDLAGQIAGQAAQLYLLSYSRSQEYESDDLSVKFLQAGGHYSPEGIVGLLSTLQRQDALQAQLNPAARNGQTPGWARTHPLTADRITRAAQKVAAAGDASKLPPVDQTAFFKAVDGLAFGQDSAAGGLVQGQTFIHPRLAIGFAAPAGYALTNGDKAVTIQGPGGVKALFSGGQLQGPLDAYAQGVLKGLVGQAQAEVGAPQPTRINGLDAVVLPAVARGQAGMMDVIVTAYNAGGQGAYHFITVAPQGQGKAAADALANSFHKLTPTEAAVARGPHIQVVTVGPGDTPASLAERMSFPDHRLERFAALNGLDPAQPLTPGQKVKLVTTGPPPAAAQPASATSRPPSKPGARSRR